MEIDYKSLSKGRHAIDAYLVTDPSVPRWRSHNTIVPIKSILITDKVIAEISENLILSVHFFERIFTDKNEALAYWEYINGN